MVFHPPHPIFAANFRKGMNAGHIKCLLVAAFSFFSCLVFAQGEPGESAKKEKESFDADEVIFGHVLDAHEFHFFSYQGKNGKEHAAVISLPVILYSPQKGFSIFMSSRFDEGKKTYRGYELLTKEKIERRSKVQTNLDLRSRPRLLNQCRSKGY